MGARLGGEGVRRALLGGIVFRNWGACRHFLVLVGELRKVESKILGDLECKSSGFRGMFY